MMLTETNLHLKFLPTQEYGKEEQTKSSWYSQKSNMRSKKTNGAKKLEVTARWVDNLLHWT